jgi:3-oxoacyl-[acyl-carrier-protein] synthase-1
MTDVAITALGAVTAVGMDAITTCASIRAGLSRPALLDHGVVLDIQDYVEMPVTGHPAGTIARGFSNVGRWLQLAPVAVADLCTSATLPGPSVDPDFWAQTKCIVILPVLGDRFLPDPNCSDEAIEGAFVVPLAAAVRRFFRPSQTAVRARGRTGVLESFATARALIARGDAMRIVVLVVDSLVDIAGVNWLLESDRIKTDVNPVGLSPGEASCAFLLEDPNAATARNAPVIAYLRAAAVAREPKSFFEGEISHGEALAGFITTVLAGANGAQPFTDSAVTDLNGEPWRAHEFGAARARIAPSIWDGGETIVPVRSTGDAGAATAGIQMAVACQALARGYAGGDSILVTCSDEDGAVGAAVLAADSGTA